MWFCNLMLQIQPAHLDLLADFFGMGDAFLHSVGDSQIHIDYPLVSEIGPQKAGFDAMFSFLGYPVV